MSNNNPKKRPLEAISNNNFEVNIKEESDFQSDGFNTTSDDLMSLMTFLDNGTGQPTQPLQNQQIYQQSNTSNNNNNNNNISSSTIVVKTENITPTSNNTPTLQQQPQQNISYQYPIYTDITGQQQQPQQTTVIDPYFQTIDGAQINQQLLQQQLQSPIQVNQQQIDQQAQIQQQQAQIQVQQAQIQQQQAQAQQQQQQLEHQQAQIQQAQQQQQIQQQAQQIQQFQQQQQQIQQQMQQTQTMQQIDLPILHQLPLNDNSNNNHNHNNNNNHIQQQLINQNQPSPSDELIEPTNINIQTTTTTTNGNGNGGGNVGNGNNNLPLPDHLLINTPYGNILQPHQQIINECLKLHLAQKEQLEKMKIVQKQVLAHPQKETFQMLDNEQNTLKKQIDAEITSLQQIDQTFVLSPPEIRNVIFLLHELTIQSIQLELYHEELQLLVRPQNPPPTIAALVVIEQPFPMVITKCKPLEDDPVVVQLLCGTRTELQMIGKVRATMIVENQQGSKTSSSPKTIETEVVSMDETNRLAKYHLKFLNGTRKNPVTLKFGMQVQVVGGTAVNIESPPSSPFIVITNECQYEESDGTLLKKDSFGNNNEIPWASYANKLQRHFLRATRQDFMKPTRYLSRHELMYIHHQFFGSKPMIPQSSFDSFWIWFGKGLQKLRYQRHVCSMWQSGLIYGFISRQSVEEALRNEEPGTFLIRFSERHAGHFAVCYVSLLEGAHSNSNSSSIRHYLVKADDTAGAKKTLPDFLSECPQFTKILQLTIDVTTGEPRLRTFPKDVVLEPYYSKRETLPATNGYDSLPNILS